MWGAREVLFQGSKAWHSGAMAHASHQCGPGSNPGIDAICGLSLLLVLSFAPRGFSPGTLVSPLLKHQHFQIPIRPGIRQTKNHFVDVLPPNHYLFIIYLCGYLGRVLWFTCVSMYHCSLIKLYKIKLYKVTSLSLYMYTAI